MKRGRGGRVIRRGGMTMILCEGGNPGGGMRGYWEMERAVVQVEKMEWLLSVISLSQVAFPVYHRRCPDYPFHKGSENGNHDRIR